MIRSELKTWQELLDFFLRTKNWEFRDEGSREEAMLEMMEYTMQKILEKLRDEEAATPQKPYRHVPLTKRESEILAAFLSEEVTYRGSIHGLIHDLGIEEFFFHLRKTGGGNLVRCDFKEDLYHDVHDAAARRHAMVYVHGLITARRVDREVTKFNVERIKVAPALTEDRYQSFFGADPNYAGTALGLRSVQPQSAVQNRARQSQPRRLNTRFSAYYVKVIIPQLRGPKNMITQNCETACPMVWGHLGELDFERVPIQAVSSIGTPFTRWVPTGMPKVPAMIRNAAFYLYPTVEAAKKGENFGGTGFLIGEPSKKHAKYGRAHIYAVTNWHVAVQGSPVIRFNTPSGPPAIFDIDVADWIFDGKHDIAVLPINVDSDKHAVTVLHSQMLVTRDQAKRAEIGPGDDVFMVGRFMDHDGGQKNRPALRFGNIAMDPTSVMQSNNVRADAYCIDLHSRSGYSGSPVFVYRTPQSDLDPPPAPRTANVGLAMQPPLSTFFMVLGIHFAQFPEKWEVSSSGKLISNSSDTKSPLLTGKQYIEGLSGMTCALPAWSIREVLDMPQLKKMREESEEKTDAIFQRDGYPPLSEDKRWEQSVAISESVPPANDANPNHREDFMRLVGAAARTPPQEG